MELDRPIVLHSRSSNESTTIYKWAINVFSIGLECLQVIFT